ncbi:MAG: GyrI-like domain-containing protein [Demequinaceae bacterium]|nr:GyrI-like domain-containing protein [Demequinaceae bacterium]
MKVDFKKTLPSYSAKAGKIDLVDIPSIRYLAVDAEGEPETSDSFHQAIGVLYPLAYTLKFASKLDLDRDYSVMPLEALWWADDMDVFSTSRDKEAWHSTVLMMIPEWITPEKVDTAKRKVASKVSAEQLGRVRVLDLVEGQCAQTLHVGSFEEEGPTVEAMHAFIEERGLVRSGKHHEIYLSDPRRVEPAKYRTILRQPVSPA